MGSKREPKGNEIHVYGGAAETEPCAYGEPFPDLPTSFLLAAPTASGKTMIILNILLRYYKDMFACFAEHQTRPSVRSASQILGEDERPAEGTANV